MHEGFGADHKIKMVVLAGISSGKNSGISIMVGGVSVRMTPPPIDRA